MEIIHSDGSNPDFIALCAELDRYLNEIAGGIENRLEYVPLNATDKVKDTFVAYDNGVPVGCASFKERESGVAEIKRVFVVGECRGRGVADQLMTALEKEARRQGFRRLILETGKTMNAALRLYQKLGFYEIENYGPYVNMPLSICLGKQIDE